MRYTPDGICVATRAYRRCSRRLPRRGLTGAITLAIVGTILVAGAGPASAFPAKLSTNGQVDFVYGSTVSSAGGTGTAYDPESKLFYTGDGVLEPIRWWAVLGTSGPTPAAGIWLYELVNHAWTARVRLPGADPWAKADALFESGTLYLSTRDDKATSGSNIRQSSLYTIPYSGGGAWGSVQGPFAITTGTLETLTLARDSANRLWATYESGGQIRVGYTAPGGTSFTTVTVSKTSVKSEDISTITAFGGDRIGVFWSDQNAKRDFFAWRSDSAPVTAPWTIETAFGGGVGSCPTSGLCAEDQMNVKVYQDQVFVSVRSNLSNSNDPSNLLLRRAASGTWSSFRVSTVAQNVSKPIVLLSPQQDRIWVWGTRGSEVDVWESSFSSPSFTSTAFVPWTKGSGSAPADPTSTKQPTTTASGEVVMASTSSNRQYWHNEFLPSGPALNQDPTFDQNLANRSNNEGATISLSAHATDPELDTLTYAATGLPTGLSINTSTGLITGTISAGAAAGSPYSTSITVSEDGFATVGATDTFTWTVTVPGPNQDPTFDQNLANRSDAANSAISLSAHATDPELDTLTYAATGLPTGLSINTSTGLISGTIAAGATAGSPYSTSITVSDDGFATVGATDTFTWTVTAAPPGGSIAFRSASTGANNVGTNVVIPTPAGVQTGDVMVAVIDAKAAPTITTPAGWTLVSTTPNGSNFRQAVYRRVVTAPVPASTTWTINESRAISGVIVAYSGVNTTTPVEVFTAGTGTTASITAPSTTSAFNGAMVIGAFGINADAPIAPPAGMTERGEIVSATRIRTEVADVVLPSAGPTGAKTATAAAAAANIGHLIVLRPAGPPPNTPPTAQDVTTTATAGIATTITLTGTDPETCELTFDRPATTLGSGATVNGPTDAACTGAGLHTDTATVTYTPPVGLSGPDSFTYSVHDGAVGSSTATVSISVSPPPNTPPTAQDVTTTATAGIATTITLTGTDPETCELSFDRPDATLDSGATVNGLAHAACAGAGPYADRATVTYTAPVDFSGPDSFTYTVNDGTAGSAVATVGIAVSAPPVAITFRSASTGANAVATSVVIPAPAGVQAGDVMVAVIDVKAAPTVTTPAGWIQVSNTVNGSNLRQVVYWRVATDSEPASYTWTSGDNRATSGAILAYSGVNPTNPVEIFSAGIGTTTSITAPSVTSSLDGAVIVGAFGINADSTIAPPADMTERGEVVSAARLRTEVADVVLSSAGATGAKIATAATAAANIGQLIALRPAGPPGPGGRPTAHDVTTIATAGVARTITLSGIAPGTCELEFDPPDATLGAGGSVSGLTNEACSGTGPYADTATVSYTAPAGFTGLDSFTYTVHDGSTGSDPATVSITVYPLLSAPSTASCLDPGRTIVTTPPGTLTSQYSPLLADDSTVDAAGTTWRPDLTTYPIFIDSGSARLCWLGGEVYGSIPPDMTWEDAHDYNQPCLRMIAIEWMVVDGLRCDNTDDGFRPRETSSGTQNVAMTIEDTYLSHIRDDCLENDGIIGGVLRDSLWEGCNTGISERPSQGQGSFTQPPGETLTLDHMLIGLEITPHRDGPGENALFKWSSSANEVVITCSIFKVDAVSLNGTGIMDIPGVVDDSACPGQPTTLVWLGGGSYPGTIPSGIEVTADVNVWNAAVADWKCRHGLPAAGCE